MTTHLILIDGSYFVFHRYHALVNWFKHQKEYKTQNITSEYLFTESNDFMEKYNKTFI